MSRRPTPSLSGHAPELALAAILAAAAAVLLWMGRGFTFIQDTWGFLLYRQGNSLDAFLDPHNEHIVAIPVAIEKLLIAVFGMSSAAPERVLLTLMLLGTAALVFVYVRRRIGPWPGVIAAALLLFLGPAWSVLLWPFEIVLVGSALTGVATLVMLDREDPRGDLAACLLLTLSVGFSSLGVPFLVAAAVDVLVLRRERGLARAYVFAIPALLFGAWYLGWGHTAESQLSLRNVLHSPVHLFEGVASSLDSLAGLSTLDVHSNGRPEWGRPMLIAALVLVVLGQLRRPGFSRRLWPVAAAGASYWLVAGFNYMPGREPTQGRYTYAGAIFVLLVAAELLRGVRVGRRALLVAGAAAALAIGSNLVFLSEGRDWLREASELTRADLAALEIAADTVDPGFTLTPEVAGTPTLAIVNAGLYLPVAARDGSPAYSPAELEDAPEYARRQADVMLGQALPLSTETTSGAGPTRSARCTAVPPGAGPEAEVALGPGSTRIEVGTGPPASLSLRRFAVEEHPVATEGAAGGSVTVLRIPRDRAPQPWRLLVEAEQGARVCPPSG